jgi:septum site-determining protein MinD
MNSVPKVIPNEVMFLNRAPLLRALHCRAFSSKVVVVSSGKGGVGKTTTAASFAYGLAEQGKKTVVIDFDIGLRNLDIHLGCERRVIFDFVNVLQEECSLPQALIKDKRQPLLSVLAASQTKDKTILTEDKVGKLLGELRQDFDYIVCDSPAGIESGARHAMYFADEAIICTNPELSSCRDSDKMIGFIASQSHLIKTKGVQVKQQLLVTRYDPVRAEREECLSLTDIGELLGLPLVGVIPESPSVLTSTNIGQPVIMGKDNAAMAYKDMISRFVVLTPRCLSPQALSAPNRRHLAMLSHSLLSLYRFLGEDVPLRFCDVEKSFFGRLFA